MRRQLGNTVHSPASRPRARLVFPRGHFETAVGPTRRGIARLVVVLAHVRRASAGKHSRHNAKNEVAPERVEQLQSEDWRKDLVTHPRGKPKSVWRVPDTSVGWYQSELSPDRVQH